MSELKSLRRLRVLSYPSNLPNSSSSLSEKHPHLSPLPSVPRERRGTAPAKLVTFPQERTSCPRASGSDTLFPAAVSTLMSRKLRTAKSLAELAISQHVDAHRCQRVRHFGRPFVTSLS